MAKPDYPIIKGLDQKIRAFVHTDAFRNELLAFLKSVDADKHTLLSCEHIADIYINYAPVHIKNNGKGDIDEKTIKTFVHEIVSPQIETEAMEENNEYYWGKEANATHISNLKVFMADIEKPINNIFIKHYWAVYK